MKENSNIIRHPGRLPFTFVNAVFLMLLVFIIAHIVLFLVRPKIQVYEVQPSSEDNITGTYKGIILRDEAVYASDFTGYMNCLAVSGERLSKDAQLLILDENGTLEKELHDFYYGQDILDQESLKQIETALKNAADQYDPMDMNTLRRGKADIRSSVFRNLLSDGGEDVIKQLSGNILGYVRSDISGFVLFQRDGYEGIEPEDLSAADFTASPRETEIRRNGDLIRKGEFVYKMAEDNKFRLVFPLTDEEVLNLSSRKSLTVRMPDEDEITGAFSITTGNDGSHLGVLFFQKYGGNYLNDRKISFKILDRQVSGYKIPESAVVSKSFFVVDDVFLQKQGENDHYGVMRKGGSTPDFVETSVIFQSKNEEDNLVIGEGKAYIYSSSLQAGDTIFIDKENDDKTVTHLEATLSVMAAVDGVYQINRGYCVFKPVKKLSASLETSYLVISSGVSGTVKGYDRIIMDPEDVKENEILFE